MDSDEEAVASDVEFILRKGERIPRKPLGDYSEADSLWHAFSRDGFWRTAMNDKNQYGPVAMMILLIIVATITGLGLKILSLVI